MKNNGNKYKKVLFFLIKIPIFFILLPYYLIKGIAFLALHVFKSFKFSIRRKITLNYLTLYSMVSLVTFLVMVSSFTIFEVKNKSDEVYVYIDQVLRKYESGIYEFSDIKKYISSIAEIENCGVELSFNNLSEKVDSERYMGIDYPDNFLENIEIFIAHRIFKDERMTFFVDSNNNEETVTIKLLQPIAPFYSQISSLSFILLLCILFGFFIIWILGSINNRSILKPIYNMTKTAEKISIRNINQEIDVSKAKYELKDLAITLNAMIGRLKKDYEKQKRFVSDVSHELRTPISIINGYAGMLKRWGKEDEAVLNESIEAIIDEAKNMQILVENLLTLVRADNQTLKFHKEDFYINELIAEVTTESKMINMKKQEVSCLCQAPIVVNLDPQMTKQMLRIFVDNAVKYTPAEGKIEIRCEKYENKCAIYVKDSGIGIGAEDLPHIFDRFYRSDESRTRETGGHGLGLSIAKAIVLGQGGKIKVKSKKNEGSEFTILLPIQ